jgi:hypothetical protein
MGGGMGGGMPGMGGGMPGMGGMGGLPGMM